MCGAEEQTHHDEVVGMFQNKRNGALLALTQTFRNVKQFISPGGYGDFCSSQKIFHPSHSLSPN